MYLNRPSAVHAAKVVDLHQFDRPAQATEGPLHATFSGLAVFAVDLGCHEDVVADVKVRQQMPQYRFRIAVVRRGIQDAAAEAVEDLQRLPQPRQVVRIRIALEINRSQPHCGDLLTGGRYHRHVQRSARRPLPSRQQVPAAPDGRRPGAQAEPEPLSARKFHAASPCSLAMTSSRFPSLNPSITHKPAIGAATSAIAPMDNPTQAMKA